MRTELNPKRVGVRVTCDVCGQQKKPVGRSASPIPMYCNDGCWGYRQEPHVGSLWPGESEMEFGYPVQLAGTRIETEEQQ